MDERDAIDAVDEPVTVESLIEDFRALGIESGDTLLVHSSLSSIGWVCGGAPAVVDALIQTVTREGTLAMPTFTSQYSNPADWEHPPVPASWIQRIRSSRPPFRTAITPTRGMGAIPECFRSYPETRRSRHPLYSVAAWGANADEIVREHAYDYGLGEDTPLSAIYERDGFVLMIGTGHETNSSLHLAEYRAGVCEPVDRRSLPVECDGKEQVVEFAEPDWSTDDFPDLGAAFEDRAAIKLGTVGAAATKLISQPELVDFGQDWLSKHR